MATKAEKAADRLNALEQIRKYVSLPSKGQRHANGYQPYHSRPVVYCAVNHVSKSGMSRDISFHVVYEGEILSISWAVGTLIGHRVNDNGVRISGCGMDMRFWALDYLAHALHRDTQGEFEAFTSGNDFEIRSL